MLLPIIFGIFTTLQSAPTINEANGTVVIQTSLGSLRGLRIQSYDNRSGFAFFAVPFAESTDGPRRFALPQPRKPWSGIRDATVKGMACPADPMLTWKKPIWDRMNEDCLHNYIFTSRRCLLKGGCAVMFAIHGGNHDFGSPVTFDENVIVHNYASDGQDVVIVVSAYRLAALGTLNLAPGRRNLSSDANVCMHDVLLSMKWVQREISSFGGDPKRVTLFGHSAGSMMAELISISPSFNGLYSQLTCMSGTYSAVTASKETNVLSSWLTAELLGCADVRTNRVETESIERVIECMRKKTWQEIIDARRALNDHPEQLFRPAPDGEGGLFPDYLPELAKRRVAVPTLIGTTTVEFLDSQYCLDEKRKVIMSRLEELCVTLAYAHNYTRPETARRLCVEYYSQGDRAKTVFEDLTFYVPTFNTAVQLTEKDVPVYLYSYAYNGSGKAYDKYNIYQAYEHPAHSEDYIYIFGNHRGPFTKKDYAIEKIYSGMFLHFAKTGYPYPGDGQSSWNKFTTSQHDYYLIDFPDSSNQMPGNRHFYQGESVELWLKTITKAAGAVRPLTEFPKYFDRYLVNEMIDVLEEHYSEVVTPMNKALDANEEAYGAWVEYTNGRRFKHLNGIKNFRQFVTDIIEVPVSPPETSYNTVAAENKNVLGALEMPVEILIICMSAVIIFILFRCCLHCVGVYQERKGYQTL